MIVHKDIEQGSEAWLQARSGRPTASEFKKLITSQGKPSKSMVDYAKTLAAEMYAGKPVDGFSGNKHTERGHELEPLARSFYEFKYDLEVEQVSFITDDAETHLASPDGLIGEDGMLEIKCLSAKYHINVIEYYVKNKKAPTDYIAQVQGQMMVADRSWNDLCFYHPDLPTLVIRNHADASFHKELKTQIWACLGEREKFLTLLNDFQRHAA